jgi:AmmeMemoRadiSam system protein B
VAGCFLTHCGQSCRHFPLAEMGAQTFAYHEDLYTLAQMLALDSKELYEVVRQRRMTMCDAIPTTAAALASQELRATTAILVRYAIMTSSDISGDLETVVGYAGLLIT